MLKKNSLQNKAVLIFLFFALLINLSSCQDIKSDAEANGYITFSDALGRTVSLKKQPECVAALLGSFADIWLLSGGEIVAASEDAWDDFGLTLEDAVNIGGAHSPSVEKLLACSPDFVIASSSTAADIKMKDILENSGIAVAYFDIDCFEDYLSMLDILTDITGRKDLYIKNGLETQRSIESLKMQFFEENIPEEEKRILLLRASSSSVKAKSSKNTILGEMLDDLGCTNIADSDNTILENLSIESIIKLNPYRIFIVTMGNDSQSTINSLQKTIYENPSWQALDAVKNNRVHIMDKRLFNLKPNKNWAEAYEELIKIFIG